MTDKQQALTLAKELQEYTRVVGSHNQKINQTADQLVERLGPPSLTDDQQEVLEWLQIYADKDSGDKPFQTIFFLWDCIKSNNLGNVELSALRKLTRAEQFQVLAAFAEWGILTEEGEG